eukprot:185768-Karenia_brevis.AAC.1
MAKKSSSSTAAEEEKHSEAAVSQVQSDENDMHLVDTDVYNSGDSKEGSGCSTDRAELPKRSRSNWERRSQPRSSKRSRERHDHGSSSKKQHDDFDDAEVHSLRARARRLEQYSEEQRSSR